MADCGLRIGVSGKLNEMSFKLLDGVGRSHSRATGVVRQQSAVRNLKSEKSAIQKDA